jgi:hypothetical protein
VLFEQYLYIKFIMSRDFCLRRNSTSYNFYFALQGAVNFALMMSQMEGGSPIDYNTITDLFLQVDCLL